MSSIICENCEEEGHAKKDCKSLPKANLIAATQKKASNFEFQEPTSEVGVIDTHCHVDAMFERVRHKGSYEQFSKYFHAPPNVEGCISSFSDPSCFGSFGLWEDLLKEDGVWGTFGMHPHNAKHYNDDFEAKIISCLSHPKAVALGECGLDYSLRSASPKDQQHIVFKRQLKVAVNLKKPVVVHCREAESDCFDIMKEILPQDWKIHLHCYTGDLKMAETYMAHFPNLYFGITNLVTYPSASQVHQNATDLPLRRILLETDAPYFVPQRLKNSSRVSMPGMIMYVAQKIAKFHDCTLDKVLSICQKNAENLYGISL
eukprot:Seg1701.8 transcript_id=Seg1701.8/GoldUCD/mRNA.D3Y31 product="putative deoxyribonuclease TATDN2" protein_id=Seg1701.8/GoldUCD/D3Y31